jgi:hypothetical protein
MWKFIKFVVPRDHADNKGAACIKAYIDVGGGKICWWPAAADSIQVFGLKAILC